MAKDGINTPLNSCNFSFEFEHVNHNCRKTDVSQGIGQGRILAPVMYKVYVNVSLNVLSNDCHAILINGLHVLSSPFADDISLLTLHPSFLKTFMNICNCNGTKWRYDFNHSKSGIVSFNETKQQHLMSLKNRERLPGNTKVEKLYEYRNALNKRPPQMNPLKRLKLSINAPSFKRDVYLKIKEKQIGKDTLTLYLKKISQRQLHSLT